MVGRHDTAGRDARNTRGRQFGERRDADVQRDGRHRRRRLADDSRQCRQRDRRVGSARRDGHRDRRGRRHVVGRRVTGSVRRHVHGLCTAVRRGCEYQLQRGAHLHDRRDRAAGAPGAAGRRRRDERHLCRSPRHRREALRRRQRGDREDLRRRDRERLAAPVAARDAGRRRHVDGERLARPGRRRLHGAGRAGRFRRQHRLQPCAHLHGRHDPADDGDHGRPGRPDRVDDRELPVHLVAARLDLRVPARQQRLGKLLGAEGLLQPCRRSAHVRRARGRRCRERRSRSGRQVVDDRSQPPSRFRLVSRGRKCDERHDADLRRFGRNRRAATRPS